MQEREAGVLSRNLEKSLHRALAHANERRHEYATLEHLLLALTEDQDAVAVLRACSVDLDRLRREVLNYVDNELTNLVASHSEDAKPTASFQRVLQRAAIHVQSSGREEVTGANVLVAMFAERESHAVYFLQEQDMTRFDAVNYISHGIAKAPGRSETRRVQGAEEEERGEKSQKRSHDALDAYCVNLNKKAKGGKIDPLIGREAEVERTIQILCRRARRTTRSMSATPASARPRSPRAWRAASCSAKCRRCCSTRRSSRSTWARCSPARAIAAISRSG